MNCFITASKLCLINTLSFYLPGSNNKELFMDATFFKNTFYRLMLLDWQLEFNLTGFQLDNDAQDFNQLVTFVEQQRIVHYITQNSFCCNNCQPRSSGYNKNSGNKNNSDYNRR